MAWPVVAIALAGAAYVLWPRPALVAATGFDVAALVAAVEALSLDRDSSSADLTDGAPTAASVTFPQDHGAHPNTLTEVWDLTANLNGPEELALAVRLTIVRLRLGAAGSAGAGADGGTSQAPEAVDRAAPRRASTLAADQVLAASLAVNTSRPGLSARAQRLSRAALGLAGADTDPQGSGRVWIEDWELGRDDDGQWMLRAAADGIELSLSLVAAKPPVVLDQPALAGVADRGAETMRLYSQSRLAVAGTLRAQAEEYDLHGMAWLDHAWGTLAQAISGQRGQLVGNRFQLQLDNGVELSCLHLRRRAGGGTPVTRCALITVDSELLALGRRDVTLEPLEGGWRLYGGVRYPLRWRLLIPARGLELEIRPALDQDAAESLAPVAGAASSWSSPVAVRGWRESDAIGGAGRMDLTGYGGPKPSET
jgi:predicted secreted hydrolase